MEVLCDAGGAIWSAPAGLAPPGLLRALAEARRCREAMSSSLLASSLSRAPRLAAFALNGRRAST